MTLDLVIHTWVMRHVVYACVWLGRLTVIVMGVYRGAYDAVVGRRGRKRVCVPRVRACVCVCVPWVCVYVGVGVPRVHTHPWMDWIG